MEKDWERRTREQHKRQEEFRLKVERQRNEQQRRNDVAKAQRETERHNRVVENSAKEAQRHNRAVEHAVRTERAPQRQVPSRPTADAHLSSLPTFDEDEDEDYRPVSRNNRGIKLLLLAIAIAIAVIYWPVIRTYFNRERVTAKIEKTDIVSPQINSAPVPTSGSPEAPRIDKEPLPQRYPPCSATITDRCQQAQ